MSNDSINIRTFSKLEYGDPEGFLEALTSVDAAVSISDLKPQIKHLRTNSLKTVRELRDAAIFCMGIAEVLHTSVRFSPVEKQDYDFVTTWQSKNMQHYCPVQLKELVPSELNPNQSINDVVNGLSKYTDSMNLTVAVKLNRIGKFEPSSLLMPKTIRIGGLWVFGAISEDQSDWGLWGDFAKGEVDQGICFQTPR
jgi:hypothetical protein